MRVLFYSVLESSFSVKSSLAKIRYALLNARQRKLNAKSMNIGPQYNLKTSLSGTEDMTLDIDGRKNPITDIIMQSMAVIMDINAHNKQKNELFLTRNF